MVTMTPFLGARILAGIRQGVGYTQINHVCDPGRATLKFQGPNKSSQTHEALDGQPVLTTSPATSWLLGLGAPGLGHRGLQPRPGRASADQPRPPETESQRQRHSPLPGPRGCQLPACRGPPTHHETTRRGSAESSSWKFWLEAAAESLLRPNA